MSFILFLYIVVISSSILFLFWLNSTIANMEKVIDRIEGLESKAARNVQKVNSAKTGAIGRNRRDDEVPKVKKDPFSNRNGSLDGIARNQKYRAPEKTGKGAGKVYHLKNRVKQK
jgi:hypothetical protein